MNSVDKLVTPMELTGELSNTQLYDKVGEYNTLYYNDNNCRLEEYEN